MTGTKSQLKRRGNGYAMRHLLAAFLTALLALPLLAGCEKQEPWHLTDVSGSSLPNLEFTMRRAGDGKTVSARDYAGGVTLLYFGYTYCPDVCPITLANVTQVFQKLGKDANDVRLLFVTVDPDRDTLPVLKRYVQAFTPQMDGLRGTDNQIATLAKRYRVSYSVRPSPDPQKYEVSHGAAIYIFDKTGTIRLLATSMHTQQPKIDGMTADIERLLHGKAQPGTFGWLRGLWS